MTLSRRSFLRTSAAAGLSLSSAPAILGARQDQRKYRTALVGSGWWGMNIFREAIKSGQCQPVALCDVDENQLAPAAAEVEKMTGLTQKKYKDYRELLDKEKPEIVVVGTPDHWHPLITIAAVRAGAHVYVEKPVGHTVMEGRAMVKAARDANRIVQVGTHRRVSPHNVDGMKFLKEGKAGRIGMVRCFVHYGGGREKPMPNEEPPQGLDWNMWCGPGPLRPYNKALHPKAFRQFMDYGNGQIGDWGIHWFDQVLWWTEEKYPKRVFSVGGRPIAGPPINDGKVQTSDAPDHQVAVYQFESFTCDWEHRKFAGNNAEKTNPSQAVGCYFYGTEGTFHMGWIDGWTFYPANAKRAPIHMDSKLNEPDGQNIKELFADFLAAIRSNRLPVCDIEIGHRSTNMSLLANLSLRLGRSIEWDGDKEQVVNDAEANKLLRRQYRAPWVYPEA